MNTPQGGCCIRPPIRWPVGWNLDPGGTRSAEPGRPQSPRKVEVLVGMTAVGHLKRSLVGDGGRRWVRPEVGMAGMQRQRAQPPCERELPPPGLGHSGHGSASRSRLRVAPEGVAEPASKADSETGWMPTSWATRRCVSAQDSRLRVSSRASGGRLMRASWSRVTGWSSVGTAGSPRIPVPPHHHSSRCCGRVPSETFAGSFGQRLTRFHCKGSHPLSISNFSRKRLSRITRMTVETTTRTWVPPKSSSRSRSAPDGRL